ncbi:MAG: hypothetical protein DHS20C12_15720 [Pseudohongiella sp.]|nr:MAG: hypothetical protein DHS20C12_15720 [Pseudohongiella sp.]
MKFREATLEDLPVLEELEQAVVEAERPYNATIRDGRPRYYDIADLISSDRSCLLVAEDTEAAGIVATGYAQLRTSKKSLKHDFHSYLGFMYVSPGYRGQGVNQQIVDRLTRWSVGQGADYLYLDVYSANESAIKAYEKAGFTSSIVEMKRKL